MKRFYVVVVVVLLIIFAAVGLYAQENVSFPALAVAEPYSMNMEELGLSQVYQQVVDSTVNIAVAGNEAPLGTGSGFVIDTDGHIVTNNHVVENAAYIEVTFFDGTTVEATLVGRDPDADLAVVKVDPASGVLLQPVIFSNSDEVFVGQQVMAIGSPFGEDFTLTTGIVSATGRTLQGVDRFSIPEVIQTDAAINPGNSGGALLNWAGQVIGVNTAILSASDSGSGIGFAIPSNSVMRVVPQLIANGEYRHTYLGLSGTALSPAQRSVMELPADFKGIMISNVVPGGPAEAAGLQGTTNAINTPFGQLPIEGDIITAVNGEPVSEITDLTAFLERNTQPGDTITLTIWRNGETMDIQVTVQERPRSQEPQ